MAEATLHYFRQPGPQPASPGVEVLAVQSFLADEAACQRLWEFAATQFRTRRLFLMIWQAVRWVVIHRDGKGAVDGLALISEHHNWQIDYVVVAPESRGQGIASMLVRAAVHAANERGVPYIMLSSKEGLRRLYEAECGFTVVGRKEA